MIIIAKDLIINNYKITGDVYSILLQLKNELTNGKLKDCILRNDNVAVTCPSHKGGYESNPSCYVYCGDDDKVEYGWYKCFTCGEQGPLYKFVGRCFNRDDEFGKEWLIDKFGVKVSEQSLFLEPIVIGSPVKINSYLDEGMLEQYQSYHPYMTKRKLTDEVIKKFKIKYDSNMKTLIFPVWDERNNLVTLTRRSVEDKRFINDSQKEKPVYLLNYIIRENLNTVVVTESQIDALTLWGYGIPAVALMGTGSKKQYEILNKCPVRHYILMLDGDQAGRNGVNKFIKNIRQDVLVTDVVMPVSQDVNDLTREEIEELLRKNNLTIGNK